MVDARKTSTTADEEKGRKRKIKQGEKVGLFLF